jgi:hypothetical protein
MIMKISQKSWNGWYSVFVKTGKAYIKSLILELLKRLPVKSTVLGAPTYVNPCYRALCNLMNLDYWYLLGEGEPISPEFEGDYLVINSEADITIDLEALHQTLEQLGLR